MRGSRIAWLVLTLAAAAAYLFENQTGTRLLLVVLLLLPILSAALLRLPRREFRVSLEQPETLERGETGRLLLRVEQTGRLPVMVRGTLLLRNRMTGEEERLIISLPVPGRSAAERAYTLLTPHCGAVELRLEQLRAVGLFGLDAKRIPAQTAAGWIVLPKLRPVEVNLAETADFLSDSLQYSINRPGYDPSETFRIREYVPGDPIRQIHWKLSEKLDRLQVRDFGLPVVERLLLLLETTAIEGEKPDPDHMDRLLDLLASVSLSLSLTGVSHVLGWQDAETGTYNERLLHTPDDLNDALAELLRQPLTTGETTVCGSFGRTHSRCAYAHVAVFSEHVVPDLELLFHGNRVTLLIPAEAAADQEVWVHGAALVLFTEDTTELEL